ncbi:hypothetical protein Xinn_03884 [Xenorhabdus innexi]|uniref:Uncharacterized protein n=1 Tax=Xenorhabdus innexi TaxID=290109 RepID=A0A2G0N099_9GAMM|nr:hypothetical protein Xinn_03884 [Xenorhabdus innexi]
MKPVIAAADIGQQAVFAVPQNQLRTVAVGHPVELVLLGVMKCNGVVVAVTQG